MLRTTPFVATSLMVSTTTTLAAQPSPEETKLDNSLAAAGEAARTWDRIWIGALIGGTALQGSLAVFAESGTRDRAARGLQIIPPAGALAIHFVKRLGALNLENDLAHINSQQLSAADRIAAKRALLAEYADDESRQRSLGAHIGPLIANLAIGGALWFGFDKPAQAALQIGIGVGLAEARLWTSPQVATRANQDSKASVSFVRRRVTIVPWASAGALGVYGSF